MVTIVGKRAGVILSGGRSSRMGGGDKSLMPLGGSTLLGRIVRRLQPQVQALAISANGDTGRFSAFGLPVLPDTVPGFAGPLAGVLAAMEWADESGYDVLLSAAGDTPFFPHDLAERLASVMPRDADRVAVAVSGGRRHPIFALWPVRLKSALGAFLSDPANRRVSDFIDAHGAVELEFPATVVGDLTFDPFFNVNTPADFAEAERIARGMTA